MNDSASLRKYAKYGFITSASCFLSFLASENPSLRPVMLYAWIAFTVIAALATLWKVERPTEEGMMVEHLLSLAEKLDVVIILSLITMAVMIGLS